MTETVVIAHITASAGKEDDLRRRLSEVARASGDEPGVVRYVLNEAVDSPGKFTLVEVYASADAFDAHLATDHVKAIIADLNDLAEPNPRIIRTETVSVDGSQKNRW
jgi:quinol monooxygenase YgiN